MIEKLTQFYWSVAPAGYKVVPFKSSPDDKEHLLLTAFEGLGDSYPGRKYVPSSGLFKNFAALEPTPKAILAFAGDWGMLTTGKLAPVDSARVWCEGIDLWIYEISHLSVALQMWESIKAGDSAGLSRYISWHGSSGVRFERPDGSESREIASSETNPALLKDFRVDDLISPARHQLQHTINAKLEGNISAKLLWNSSKTRTTLGLYQVPKDLISALWLQLARAIEGDRKYQQCEECRNWFEVSSPDGGRTDKRFCSPACRAREWRNKKKGGS